MVGSPERRAKHAAAIRIWAPWNKSTGPRTIQGKQRSSQNAFKHGNRARDYDPATLFLKAALARHTGFLRAVRLYTYLLEKNYANELLNQWEAELLKMGRTAGVMLTLALKVLEMNDRNRYQPANDG